MYRKISVYYGVMLPESGRLCKLLVRKSAKNGLQGEDLLEVEPLVSRVEERLESLKSLTIFGLEKGQKYSLFMGQVHNAFIINTTFI